MDFQLISLSFLTELEASGGCGSDGNVFLRSGIDLRTQVEFSAPQPSMSDSNVFFSIRTSEGATGEGIRRSKSEDTIVR